jgi:hypothetical protein
MPSARAAILFPEVPAVPEGPPITSSWPEVDTVSRQRQA